MNANLKAVFDYIDCGFSVFPLRPRSKEPFVSGGFKAATVNRHLAESWWRRLPDAGIGIATGAASNLLVLDIDPRNDGDESYADVRSRFGPWADAPIVHTGGGGTHEWFRYPSGGPVPCRNHVGGLRGLDVKGDGGYIVAPPTIHPNGVAYEFDAMFGIEIERPEPPAWLVDLVRAGERIEAESYVAPQWDGTIPDRVAYAAAVSSKVARRFQRQSADLVDMSPSGVDFSLACLLARFKCDGATIEAGLRASRARAGLPPKRPSYFASTVGKALALANEERTSE
jgi:hypothetical protein